MTAEMSTKKTEDRALMQTLLKHPDVRVFLPVGRREGGVFRKVKGVSELTGKIDRADIERFLAQGTLRLVASTGKGQHFKPVLPADRNTPPRTAKDRKNAAWLAAERVFSGPDGEAQKIKVSLGESPLGWLSRRRDPQGRPFLGRDEVAAGERLRADFEQSQLAPSVTFDWRRMLTTVDGGSRGSAQERDLDGGATAARQRLHAALDSLGPGLADVALRACCFLEGLETVEASMNWSARSGKIVLRIALQRLSIFYEQESIRSGSKIEVWQSSSY